MSQPNKALEQQMIDIKKLSKGSRHIYKYFKDEIDEIIAQARTEALTEFAGELKGKAISMYEYMEADSDSVVLVSDIDTCLAQALEEE